MDAYAEYQLGITKFEARDYDGALEHLTRSIQQEEHFKTRHHLYKVCLKLGQAEEAFEHLEKAYAANPRNDRVACDYASELRIRGNASRAHEVLLEVLARNPNYGPARDGVRILASNQ